jgi:xylulokinase
MILQGGGDGGNIKFLGIDVGTCGTRALVIWQAEEGAAYGAAILAGTGSGNWRSVDEACDAVVQTAHKTQPDSKSAAILDDAYLTYRKIYPALRQLSNSANAESAAQPVVSVS